MEGSRRVAIDGKKITKIEQMTFYRLAPLDTWAIFVEEDYIHLGQRMLSIFGKEMVEIDREAVTKAPVIFSVPQGKWVETINSQIIPTAQAMLLILPEDMRAAMNAQMHQLGIPFSIVS